MIDAQTKPAFLARTRVLTDGAGCWRWTGYLERAGYGSLKLTGWKSKQWAHRLAYELFRGPVPDGLVLDHTCRNRWCVNPAHLTPVTRGENVLRGDGPTAWNLRVATCPQGHLYRGANLFIDKRGSRRCRECARQRYRRAKETA